MTMKIAVAQFNATVGDLAGNTDHILRLISEAREARADVLLVPELAIAGYPPEDLLLRPSFYQACNEQLDRLLDAADDVTLIVGHPVMLGQERFNGVTVMRDGNFLARGQKMVLPNNEVFDECRYFTPGALPCVYEQRCHDGSVVMVGVPICEDIWHVEPASEAADMGAQILLVPNASPYHVGKDDVRQQIVRQRIEETGLPIVYCNWVGGQDELVFDGASFAMNRAGELVAQLPRFESATAMLSFSDGDIEPGDIAPTGSEAATVYQALVVATRDYIVKNGFPGAIIGLSGGIDSALTLAIAVDALGADKVRAVMMPSRYTAQISLDDSREMIRRLGVQYDEISIEPMYEAFGAALAPQFAGLAPDTTEENLQSRIRGVLLMALSNKTGRLVLTTGNKSEMTTGYATLYGDMAGGYAVLKDIAKTLVYRLSQYRNSVSDIIPDRIITRPPSAELRDNQVDQDSLPPYDILDAIMALYVEKNLSMADIIARGYSEADVLRVVKLLKINEYKRRQAAIGARITPRGFGRDWRYPVTNRFLR
ncbi:NAD+ synthase [Chitinimonas prasina]|uniref:Glutamine-dependent NAD(+) synthetase n=1 Tax=Chitinimonas prasina TaxID=1434937 RepID=A0ABQ5YQZ6_9NEIS|nr:NAD+ synthase [Chitinimonas prasina]GLR15344.1 NAD+ synthase [Chitinimonas prasina]